MIATQEINNEVLFSRESVTLVSGADIAELKVRAAANARKRVRLCAHPGQEDGLHDMLIVHGRDAYVRPHMHLVKPESFHIVEGSARFFVFDDDGAVARVEDVGEAGSGVGFFCRIPPRLYHSFIILSDWLVFHESTLGPFVREQLAFAPWSPDETATERVDAFQSRLLELAPGANAAMEGL